MNFETTLFPLFDTLIPPWAVPAEEAARKLGVDINMLWVWAVQGELSCVVIGGKFYYPEKDLIAFHRNIVNFIKAEGGAE